LHGRVLVTGAGGFIGSHLCERLVRDGANVRALCRYTSERSLGNLVYADPAALEEMDVWFGDLLDTDFVAAAIRGCDVVFHLAASISVAYSFEAPRQVVATNVEGSLNVLSAALREGAIDRIVHLSSSEVYGTAQYTPIDEQHPLHAQSPYAASKVGADKLAEAFHLSYELPVAIARPFNTFGPRQSLRAVIPTVIAQARAGSIVRLGATSPTRDFVYVADTVDALVRLASAGEVVGKTFNIATGVDVSVADVVELVGEILGRPLRIHVDEDRMRPPLAEVFQLQGDATHLREATGWQPEMSLRDGLQAVIEWMGQRDAAPTAPEAYAL